MNDDLFGWLEQLRGAVDSSEGAVFGAGIVVGGGWVFAGDVINLEILGLVLPELEGGAVG